MNRDLIWDFYTEEDNGEEVDMAMSSYKGKSILMEIRHTGEVAYTLKCSITEKDIQNNKNVMCYFYKRTFVGMGEIFQKQMMGIVDQKRKDLELIASEED
jgi:hypothetical protein